MNASLVSLAFLVGVPAIIIALVVFTRGSRPRPPPRERVKRPDELFREAFATDPAYGYDDAQGRRSTLGWMVSSRSGHPTLTLEALDCDFPGNHWVITATSTTEGDAPPRALLNGRTTLACSRQGPMGALENAIGLEDVHTGDVAFDAQVTIVGSDRDVVRAVVQQPPVIAALKAIFSGDPPGMRCEVDHRGQLNVSIYRSHLDSDEARVCLTRARALFEAIEAASDVEAMPLQERVERSEVGSVAASSGAPVGFGGSLLD